MVDLRQPSTTLHREQRDPAVPDPAAGNGRDAAGSGSSFQPVVVGVPSTDPVSVLVERTLTEQDIPWLFYLCRKQYASKFDAIATEVWFRNTVLRSPLLYCPQRTDNAFCISMMTTTPWVPFEFEASVVFICADDTPGHTWEVLRLLRASVAWAKLRRCAAWRCASETDSDLTAFARRVGATEISPRFTLRL